MYVYTCNSKVLVIILLFRLLRFLPKSAVETLVSYTMHSFPMSLYDISARVPSAANAWSRAYQSKEAWAVADGSLTTYSRTRGRISPQFYITLNKPIRP